MATIQENALTREGLIWRIVECVSESEGKQITVPGNEKQGDREYIMKLVREASHAVGGR